MQSGPRLPLRWAGGGGGCCSASLPGSEQSDLQSGGQVCGGGALPAPRIGAEQGRTLLCKVMAGGGWRAPRFPTLPSRPEALCTHPFHYNFSFKNRGEAHVAVSRQSAASRSEPRAGASCSLAAPCGLGNVEATVSKRSCHRDLLGARRSPSPSLQWGGGRWSFPCHRLLVLMPKAKGTGRRPRELRGGGCVPAARAQALLFSPTSDVLRHDLPDTLGVFISWGFFFFSFLLRCCYFASGEK